MQDNTFPRATPDLTDPVAPMGMPPRDRDGDDLLVRATAGAHEAVDRFADKAAPAVHKLGTGVTHASEALREGAHRAREIGDEWRQSLRGSVRDQPLTSVMVAMGAGWLIGRLMRPSR